MTAPIQAKEVFILTYILWGTLKGNEDWQEELIHETENPATLGRAREWAANNGFNRFRVSVFKEGDMPDFKGALRI